MQLLCVSELKSMVNNNNYRHIVKEKLWAGFLVHDLSFTIFSYSPKQIERLKFVEYQGISAVKL